jgi:hypothetical protein
MTEHAGPIPDSYWVIPGRVLAGPYPGAATDAASAERLALLRDAGIDCFIDLTAEGEYSLHPYAAVAAGGGAAEHRRHAIRDFGCPSADGMRAILDAIDDAVGRGRLVYVHCFGGVGRTGTVIGCYLVRHGTAPPDALQAIARRREGTPNAGRRSPETDEQREFVLTWREPS